MFNLFNFHFHLTVQEIKVLFTVGSDDANASVDQVVRSVLGMVISLLFAMAVLSFLAGVILVIVTFGKRQRVNLPTPQQALARWDRHPPYSVDAPPAVRQSTMIGRRRQSAVRDRSEN